jgi:hypothetical protein
MRITFGDEAVAVGEFEISRRLHDDGRQGPHAARHSQRRGAAGRPGRRTWLGMAGIATVGVPTNRVLT